MTKPFLHELAEFRDLLEITAQEEKIQDPALVEKDYWLMHVLWGLQQLNFSFHLKGGTSLSKGHGCIYRFSEDIDIKIEAEESAYGFKVYTGKNQDDGKHRDSRQKYFDWICERLQGNIAGIENVKRDPAFDDQPKYRSGGIRLVYASHFMTARGLKDGILLEVGFDRTTPNQPKTITSWAYERANGHPGVDIINNRAVDVLCYEPRYTFVEKLQTVVRKFRLYKNGAQGASLPANFIRHYYDLYQLVARPDIQSFIGTDEYERFKRERFGRDDPRVAYSDAFRLTLPEDRSLFEKEYVRSESLYYKGRPTLQEILDRLGEHLERL